MLDMTTGETIKEKSLSYYIRAVWSEISDLLL